MSIDSKASVPQPPAFPGGEGQSAFKNSKNAPGRFRFTRVVTRWWWIVGIIFSLFVYVGMNLPTWFKARGPLFESTVILELNDPSHAGGLSPGAHSTSRHAFISTEKEIIKSDSVLSKALQNNELLKKMGGDEVVAIEQLKESIRFREQYGTALVYLSCRDESPQLARDMVDSLLAGYMQYKIELIQSERKLQIETLASELENQIKRVSELSEKIASLQSTESNNNYQKNLLKNTEQRHLAAKRTQEEIQKKHDEMVVSLGKTTSNVVVHEKPIVPSEPATKGKDFYTNLTVFAAVFFSAITSLILIYLAEAIFPRKIAA